MMNLENSVLGKQNELAKNMLVVMIRSLASNWCFPLCGFASKSLSADYLYAIIWRTISAVETQSKLKVLFLTFDGASTNRRFYSLHRVDNEGIVYKTVNLYDVTRDIYFISDVPHLLKTTRNNFSNSFSHKHSKKLWRNGMDISWMHVVKLFENHCELNLYSPCPKLSRSHIDLVSYNYMKVNLAAQILSESVACALEDLYGQEVQETVIFLRHMNKFFDCLNVRSLSEGKNKRNPNLQPYVSVDDERLAYLCEDFLGYLVEWEEMVEKRNGKFTRNEKATMLLSHQTMTGLKMSVMSICASVKIMLNAGAEYVLTHSFNQDPLEQHFGLYRHKSGANSNPSVYEVQNMMSTIRTVAAQALPTKRGNIKCSESAFDIDNTQLPRRKSHRQ
ncbi:hypothetical protein DPMN_063462 [Dreissena polymorpha]|uniref:Transposable element P transposase n=1 Tax=Dreissena polymorpha TaxID=45954 RepID=A0A9D4CAK2_DREPO|nr:hypothetical protein DPMN_063462 [Dreissena polymorpha]